MAEKLLRSGIYLVGRNNGAYKGRGTEITNLESLNEFEEKIPGGATIGAADVR
jgi:hypothetical protein